MKNIFVFSYLLLSTYICAQTKISDVDHFFHPEELQFSSQMDTVTWRGELYVVTSAGTYLHFDKFDLNAPKSIDIDLDVPCENVYTRTIRVYGDQLFIASPNILFEIDLGTETLEHTYTFAPDETISRFSKDRQNGLLLTFRASSQEDVPIARIDLATQEVTSRSVDQASSTFILGDYIVSLSADGLTLSAHDLRELVDVPLVENRKSNLISTVDDAMLRYFYDEENVLYELSSSLEVSSICNNFEVENYFDFFIFEGFAYKYYQPEFSPARQEIVDLATCQTVASFTPSLTSSSFFIRKYGDTKSLIWNSNTRLVVFDHETYQVSSYLFPGQYLLGDVLVDKYAYGFITDVAGPLTIYRLDFATEQVTTFETELSSGWGTVRIRATDEQSFTVAGSIRGKHTLVEFDSSFTETNRAVFSDEQNFGLRIANDKKWSITGTSAFLQYNNNILELQEDTVVYHNDSIFRPDLVYVRDTLYAYLYSNDSTFFTVSNSEGLIYKEHIEDGAVSPPNTLVKVGNTIYSKTFSGLRKLYPEESAEEEDLPFVVDRIHFQFEDKVLLTVEKDDKDLLAIYDGENFQIVSETDIWSSPKVYQCWTDGRSIKLFTFNTVDDGAIVVSADELSGEVLFVEEVTDIRLSLSDSRTPTWKVLYFLDRSAGTHKAIVTDGIQVQQHDLSEEADLYGNLHSLHFANGQLFFSASGMNYVRTPEKQVVELSDIEAGRTLESAVFVNNKYYIIHTDANSISLISMEPGFEEATLVFETENVQCLNYRENYFVAGRENEGVLMVLNTASYGRELWELNSSSDEVSLLADLNEGKKNGFEFVQFLLDDQLYFTGQESDVNTQLYKIAVQPFATTATTDEYTPPSFILHPNPTTGAVQLDIPLSSMRLFSSSGVEYLVPSLSTDSGSTFDMESLPQGIYFLTGIDRQGVLRSAKLCKL